MSTRPLPSLSSAVKIPRIDAKTENQSKQSLQILPRKMRQVSETPLDAEIGKQKFLENPTNDETQEKKI